MTLRSSPIHKLTASGSLPASPHPQRRLLSCDGGTGRTEGFGRDGDVPADMIQQLLQLAAEVVVLGLEVHHLCPPITSSLAHPVQELGEREVFV